MGGAVIGDGCSCDSDASLLIDQILGVVRPHNVIRRKQKANAQGGGGEGAPAIKSPSTPRVLCVSEHAE